MSTADSARSAAFFDLDRTLMAGVSAFSFARAGPKSGLGSRPTPLSDCLANLALPLKGATAAATDAGRERGGRAVSGGRRPGDGEGCVVALSDAFSSADADLPSLRLVGGRVVGNPVAALARVAREEGWDVVRFETLGRRLRLIGAVVAAALAGSIGSV